MSYVGVYVGPSPAALAPFEQWLGRPADSIAIHTGKADWADWTNSIASSIKAFAPTGRELTFSIPMFANSGNLAAAATGAYDSYYQTAAKTLLASWDGQGPIYIRTGEEFNGTWFGWSAKGRETQFISAFQHFVTAFRSVSPNAFKFEWNVNIGDSGMDPASAYPGDAYVDVVGMDFYYNAKWDNPDPLAAWSWMETRKYGLQWLESFASAHGKPTAYSEWGVSADNAGIYIDKAAQWFASHNTLYNNYWNTNASFPGQLSNGQNPATGLEYQAAFGGRAPPASAAGNTLYVAVTPADLIFEGANGGIDTVQAAFSYRLNHNVENLVLTGALGTNGTGNELNNLITGTAGANSLAGMSGDDTLKGGAGNDSFLGGVGNDRLEGGLGDDAYYYEPGDVVIENPGEGVDTYYVWASVTLPANVENLVITQYGATAALGNALANVVTGNSGNNGLYGNGGDDTLIGGGGNDTLTGGQGADQLTGGAGNDSFVYNSVTESGGTLVDRITDLAAGDRIDLSKIDANTKLAGDQAFTRVTAFHSLPGEALLAYSAATNLTTLKLDTNGDSLPDVAITMTGDQNAFTGWVW